MITYDDVWYPLQAGVSAYTGVQVIRAESEGEIPAYPFIAVKQITPFIGVGQPNILYQLGKQVIQQQTETVFSFTISADSIESAADTANKARLYFLGKGAMELSDARIAIVSISNAQNRDVFLTDEYERRIGFDVRLRVCDVEEYFVDVIEKVSYTMEE